MISLSTPQTPTLSLICSHPRVTHKYPMESCHILDLTLRWWTNPTGPGEARISDLSLQKPPLATLLAPLHASPTSLTPSPITFSPSYSISAKLHLPRKTCLRPSLSALSSEHASPPGGAAYTARNSFEGAPQDVVMRIITGPDGWCYISVPSHTHALPSAH